MKVDWKKYPPEVKAAVKGNELWERFPSGRCFQGYEKETLEVETSHGVFKVNMKTSWKGEGYDVFAQNKIKIEKIS
jgi:hypothetical protein